MRRGVFILAIIGGILLNACATERKLAREFVQNTPDARFLIIWPDMVFKESLKPIQNKHNQKLTDRQKDSIAFMESEFIRYIPDSTFFNLYISQLLEEFKRLGINAIPDTMAGEFFQDTGKNAYILNIAQLQLQEFSEIVYDTEEIDNQYYYHEHILNGIHLNKWVEFQKINSDRKSPLVLFNELTTGDQVDGFFRKHPQTGQMQYSFKMDTLTMSDVHQWIEHAGETHARYFFDFLMNQYIRINLAKRQIKPRYYLHYDRENDQFVPANEKRYIRINE